MNKSVIDFSRGIKSVKIDKYRSESGVNTSNDMARITIYMSMRENRALYNALKNYDEKCDVNPVCSRCCEHGTKGCVVKHEIF